MDFIQQKDLSRLNTLGLKSLARNYISLCNKKDLTGISGLLKPGVPYFILGGGSNVVLSEQVDQIVVHNQLKGICLVRESDTDWLVEAAAGEIWHDFVVYCTQQGWYGLENLALIPGTVGAAPVQNIGAYGVEVKDRLDSVVAYDPLTQTERIFNNEQCRFAYRDSIFKHEDGKGLIITAVRFRLPKQWVPVLSYPDLQQYEGLQSGLAAQAVLDAVCEIRRRKLPDPKVTGNAGSFFKNPIVSAQHYWQLKEQFPGIVAYEQPNNSYKLAAGWMIDQCGWKGRQLGNAGVHARQALVIINTGNACAADIIAIAKAIAGDVRQKFGVSLEPEPVFVGTGF
ncbi:UDP-N-acetylmuramate dehydrogenase [Advenella sp. RU8]|uniref:UDP-N-acetylmuramate dehydrogenase n=1 Tax=Advenella sp. RU8 TaxID=3399575 RepID=UPI003AAA5D74